MKRVIALLLAICMMLSLAACSVKKQAAVNPDEMFFSEEESNHDKADEPDNVETMPAPTPVEQEKEEMLPEETVPAQDQPEGTIVQTGDTSSEEKPATPSKNSGEKPEDEKQDPVQPDSVVAVAPTGEYNNGVVLVKVKDTLDEAAFGDLQYTAAEPLYAGSKWYVVQLADTEETENAVPYLTALGTFDAVDYDYIMATETTEVLADVASNPEYTNQKNHGTHKIPEGWSEFKKNGKHPGGSSDVIVALIDTGVDYNHLDLRNNIWTNSAEIPNNGIDDDDNGYIDDVYGWDCVGDDNDPMDDNGHGTHVAGIIAAENNKIGGVGVAYGCKVMVLKAGNSSGYFNNSDIAEAIQYAYMNGASVINMSFGGTSISLAVKESLENAYNTCVLVAAAGNSGSCNYVYCGSCETRAVCYPAALPYVIGVMSVNADGTMVSGFSNYDHWPFNETEYEVYAVGEKVYSTWPNNQYAYLSGTSMAAPTVSGIAALLRSYYTDRSMYSNKYIQSQIVNTGTINPYIFSIQAVDNAHSVANAYEAATRLPKPAVNLYDYTIDDSIAISTNNNGNGVIDAGETIRISVALYNRGGVATNVNVSADTMRNDDPSLVDPYFTFVNNTITLSDIGTYSVRESGADKYFEIIVSPDCPNDYAARFNIRYTYMNGLDTEDGTLYADDGNQVAYFNISNGYHLPAIIQEDTVFTNDRLYILSNSVTIAKNATVTFEEGCRIQFYDDSEYYNSPCFRIYGTLNLEGSKEHMISMYPSERHPTFVCMVENLGLGTLNMNYVNATNFWFEVGPDSFTSTTTISNSAMKVNTRADGFLMCYDQGVVDIKSASSGYADDIHCNYSGCYIELPEAWLLATNMDGNYIYMPRWMQDRILCYGDFTNNILCTDVTSCDNSYYGAEISGAVTNNMFISAQDENVASFIPLKFNDKEHISNNYFSDGYRDKASQLIVDYIDSNGTPILDVYGSCSNLTALYPHVVSAELFNADGAQVLTVGKEEFKVRVTFSRPMDTTKAPAVTFGTIAPYADYKIEGSYISDTVWEGTYTLKAQNENGLQTLIIQDACAANDPTKVVRGQYQPYQFNIDTTEALSMSLFANATENGIELSWVQDDYDTLMGYNIYRATAKDGNYVKINPAILLDADRTFLDADAEPGVTYWYTFTVVLSDFSESAPAGKVSCTALDTILPTVYHTPVNQGYQNNNLVISCTASDNMKIDHVMLYYRTCGAQEWKSLQMSKVNDKYSATVFGSELSLDGLEYYIVASDGVNTISKGSAETPYFVVIKDASSASRLGDVDGNGVVATKDALMLMQCLNGDLLLTDDQFKRADLNGNGELASVEALRILQYINGKVSTLEM